MDSQYDPKSTMITTTISQVSRTTRNVVRFCTILLLFCCCSSLHTTNASAVPHPVEMGINNAQTEIGLNITKILNTFFASGVYDKRVRPNYAGPPVKVGVTMYIISISSVSEVQMDFTSDFYFRQGWRDPRLSFKPRPGIDALFVGAEVADRIWNPDTFFANEKSAQFHLATTPNTFIRISANGDVLRSTRLTVTSSCAMNLQYFPMDRQMCTIEVESYGYSMSDIMYNWGIDGKGSASIADNVELPQFNINGLKQNSKVEVLNTGNYSRLICEIEFVRSMGYYLIQIYIPASLIVIISWVSFWLHRNASPARVQLGVTTVLTMTTLMSSTNAALPKISYIKSIDVYLGTCFVMVFASLLEYATVGYMGKRIAMRKSRSQQLAKIKQRAQQIQQVKNSSNVEIGYHSGPPHMAPHHPQHAQSILGLPLGEQVPSSGGPSPRQRNSIANAPEMRYRMIGGPQGLLPPHAQQQQQQQQQPQLPEKGRPSFDFSKKKISLAPAPDSDTEEGGGGAAPGTPSTPPPSIPVPGSKNQNSLFGVCPSDIDKYSRVVFPVCFLCFNLMYWIIYMHISAFLTDENDES